MWGHVGAEGSCHHQVLEEEPVCGSDSLPPSAAGIPPMWRTHYSLLCCLCLCGWSCQTCHCQRSAVIPRGFSLSLSPPLWEMKTTAMWNGIAVARSWFTEGDARTPVIFNQHKSLRELYSDGCSANALCFFWFFIFGESNSRIVAITTTGKLPQIIIIIIINTFTAFIHLSQVKSPLFI